MDNPELDVVIEKCLVIASELRKNHDDIAATCVNGLVTLAQQMRKEIERLQKAIMGDDVPKFAAGIDPVVMLEERKV